jgi:hypothetical protein
MRGPGEDYSDVILRLAEAYAAFGAACPLEPLHHEHSWPVGTKPLLSRCILGPASRRLVILGGRNVQSLDICSSFRGVAGGGLRRWGGRRHRRDRPAPGEAAAGIVGGLTGTEAPRFRHYVVEEKVPSYTWAEHPRVVVGDVLPAEGVILHPVPNEYGVTGYQYTVVDDTPVLVDPATRRIIEVVP